MALLSLSWLEVARFRRSLLTKLALVVAFMLPAVYAGANIAANWDPTGRLSNLTGAVVDQDQPAQTTGADGKTNTVAAGTELTDTLTEDGAAGLNWRRVSDPQEAADGLRDGTYAAVMTIPPTFSADLTSVGAKQPRPAKISVVSDDAQNFVLANIVTNLTTNLRDSLAASTTEKYLDNVYVGFNTLHDQIGSAADNATKLADGTASADTGADELVVGLGDLRNGTGQLGGGTTTLKKGATSLADGTGTLASGAGSAADGAATLSHGLDKLHTGSSQLPAQTRQLADGATTVADGADGVADGAEQLAAGVHKLTKAVDGAAQVPAALTGLKATLGQASGTVGEARSDLRADVLPRIKRLADADPSNADLQQLLDAAQELDANLNPSLGGAADRLDEAAGAAGQLADGTQRLTAGLQTLDTQVGQLATGARQVATGAEHVATGNSKLADATPALAEGIQQADNGAQQLAAGTGQLASGADDAASGARKLADGAAKVDSAAHQLAAGTGDAQQGAQRLADGTAQLADGSDKLADGLHSGADDIPSYDSADRANRSAVGAQPVTVDRVRNNHVAYYGEGLAPLYIALSLWIGGMVTYMLLRAVSKRALASTASSWRAALSGWLPGGFFAVVQAVVAVTLLHVIVGLDAPNLVATAAFAVLVAGVFAAIHQCLNALFGGVGRLVALLLLILQLAAAGATYPVQTAPGFFTALHSWLPLTYAVQGLRHLIAGGSTATVWTSVIALLGFGAVAFAITLFACHKARTWSIAKLHPSLSL